MRKILETVLGVLLLGLLPAQPYVRSTTQGGAVMHRTDSSRIQFLVSESLAPGMTNAGGQPMITRDSDPRAALEGAMAAWGNVSSASVRFAPLTPTGAGNDPQDNRHVMVFADSPEIRSIVGSALALTLVQMYSDGRIIDTDIIFNPNIVSQGRRISLSTNLAADTVDLQSLATHEIGHALGANHTGILSAAMFQTTETESNAQSRLAADDIAFVTDAYPDATASGAFGSVIGRVSLAGGGPARGAHVVAIDPATGVAVGALASLSDGSYEIRGIPFGNYQVYAEPLSGTVRPAYLGIPDAAVTTDFQPGFLGGTQTPQTLSVNQAGPARADLVVPGGASGVRIELLGTVQSTGGRDISTVNTGPRTLAPGRTVDLLLFGPGLDATVRPEDLRLLGPGLAIRPGSVRVDGSFRVNGRSPVRFTVDVAARADSAVASILVSNATGTAVFSGALLISPQAVSPTFTSQGVTNAASFLPGPVAPGEIVTIFGTNLGPAIGQSSSGVDPSTNRLPLSLAGVRVTFDGTPAPLFYVGASQINLQVPMEVSGKASTDIAVEYMGSTTSRVTVPLAAQRPGIFQFPGTNRVYGFHWPDYSVNSASNPVSRESMIILFGTGQGAVSPPLATGEIATTAPLRYAENVTATIGGQTAQVAFAGMAPGFAGLMQINIVVPRGVTPGDSVPLQVSVSGVASQAGTVISVR